MMHHGKSFSILSNSIEFETLFKALFKQYQLHSLFALIQTTNLLLVGIVFTQA
jgi:hypothetical protein